MTHSTFPFKVGNLFNKGLSREDQNKKPSKKITSNAKLAQSCRHHSESREVPTSPPIVTNVAIFVKYILLFLRQPFVTNVANFV